MSEVKRVTVKSTAGKLKDGGFKLAIFDRSEDYEGGELYIADDKAHDVPLTTAVKAAINEGRLAETDEKSESESTGTTGTNVDVNALTNQPLATGAGLRQMNAETAKQVSDSEAGQPDGEVFVNRDTDTAETLADRYDRKQLDTLAEKEGVPAEELAKARTKGDVAELILAKE